jgi:cytochrome c2
MKKLSILFSAFIFVLAACGGGEQPADGSKPKSMVESAPADDGKGIGEFKEIALNNPLNQDMVSKGKAVYDLKCAACHKLSDQRVVGPGWKGVTARRKPEWIMNMTTNVDIMLEKDPAAQEMLKQCLVRMPNQNLSADDARNVLEFMFNNDANAGG